MRSTQDRPPAAVPDRGDAGTDEPVFAIRDLRASFGRGENAMPAVAGVDYELRPGETLGIVGESGSGKSVTVMAALGLLPPSADITVSGAALLRGRDLITMSPAERRAALGGDIAMIFQDPISSLNPVQRIGDQIVEMLRLHDPELGRQAARARAVELLALVGVPRPEVRARQYPHEFSGGMCQRAMIALAIANRPKVLIADEPTTAVDVSVQAQILDVIRIAAAETGAATVLISHDLGVIAEMADRICVMYGGRVVETGPTAELLREPRHPYTPGLLACIPRLEERAVRLTPIPGQPPTPAEIGAGCAFAAPCAGSAAGASRRCRRWRSLAPAAALPAISPARPPRGQDRSRCRPRGCVSGSCRPTPRPHCLRCVG